MSMNTKLKDLISQLGLEVYTKIPITDQTVSGAYVSDLLSDVMGNAAAGNIWITMQAHPNVVAVASLRDLTGVILVKGIHPSGELLKLAEKENIPLLGTKEKTFEISGKLFKLIGS